MKNTKNREPQIRCKSCQYERIDGNPCNPAGCLCCCHRRGVEVAHRIMRAAKDTGLSILRTKHFDSPMLVPKSFTEEFGAK